MKTFDLVAHLRQFILEFEHILKVIGSLKHRKQPFFLHKQQKSSRAFES